MSEVLDSYPGDRAPLSVLPVRLTVAAAETKHTPAASSGSAQKWIPVWLKEITTMPRVTQVKAARKSPGNCGKCGCEIKEGEPYRWWHFRFGPKMIRCGKIECAPRPADLTRSEYQKAIYGIQETNFHSADSIESLENMKDEIIGELDALRDEQEEKRNNMPEALQESDSGNLLQERYDALQSAIDDLEAVDISFDDGGDPENEDALNDRISEIADELSSALSNL